ncbi:MAG: rRNA maturation RNase YbeY [Microthrixaceae bacterium]
MNQSAPQVSGVDERDRPDETSAAVDLDRLTDLIANVLQSEGIPGSAEASLTLVDPDVIAELKAQHLDGDGSPTDVLSFPIDGAYDGTDAPEGDADVVVGAADASGSAEVEAVTWLVGDIVLCPDVAAAQAAEHAGTVDDEMALLVVHGALHLVGWDHDDPDSQSAMWNRERELMKQFHRTPARDPWSVTEEMS